MISKSNRSVVGVFGLVVALAAPAQAQWRTTAIGVAEVDTKETLLLLAGLSASPGGQGLHPIIGVQGYHLGAAATGGRSNAFVVKPYAGLGSGYNGGAVHGTLGYAFSNKDIPVPTSTGDTGDGVVIAAGWDHWGTGSPWGHQVLGSYNFGSEGFWGRGRLTRKISSTGAAQRRFGGEVAYLTGTGYSGVQPGAIFEMHNGRGGILGLGAGMKFFENTENAVYFKVEGVLPIAR
ncbi:MAG: hypothetical protein ABIR92_10375 [Gemmatimonadaceae bacterium]